MNEEYNNGYNNYDFNSYNQPQPPKQPKWASVTSFVLSLVNVVLCCCGTYLFAPLSIIFGIVSLVKKQAAKSLAVTGIILSSLALAINIGISVAFKEPIDDMVKFATNADSYIEEYHETGEPPEDFQKYNDPKYDKWWSDMGYEDFNEFFDAYMEDFERSYQSSGSSGRDEKGEKPVDL